MDRGDNGTSNKEMSSSLIFGISMRQAAMYIVPRFRIRLFRYSVFTLVGLIGLLGLWIVTNRDLSALVKYERTNGINAELELHIVVTKAFRVASKNVESRTNTILNVRGNQEKMWVNVVKYPKTDSDFSGDKPRGIKIKKHDDKTDKPPTFWKVDTNKLNRDTTGKSPFENKTTFPSTNPSKVRWNKTQLHSQETNPRTVQPSKQSLFFPSQTTEVYGEPGCPDNPWRQGLSELFQAWTDISKQHNIEYVLACGSLLGAMRNGDVIPYDSDIDILIDINYWPIMKRLSGKRNFKSSDRKIHLVMQPEFTLNIPVESRKRYDCQGKETPHLVDECSFQEPMGRLIKGNVHIDFFHFYERVHYVDDPSNSKVKQYHKKAFYPFTPCTFMGFKASCPSKPWEVLRIYFNSENFEPVYKCKNGTWIDEHGVAADVF